MNRTVHLEVHGRVQGVWYRVWAVEQARALGLSGWIRNCRGGTVEAVLSGDPDNVGQMIAKCYDGSTHAKVSGVIIEDYNDAVPVGFNALPTE